MRFLLATVAPLLLSTLLLATEAGAPDRPVGPALDRNLAVQYAQQLASALAEVSRHYYREVSIQELAASAVAGLYEAARLPLPDRLPRELRDAVNADDVERILVRTRLHLGDLEPLRGDQALLVSLQAMVRSLDPYSAVVHGDELRRGGGEESRLGFGLEVDIPLNDEPVIVKSVALGGPAQRAGLRPGDRITHLDDQPAARHGERLLLLKENATLKVRFVRGNGGQPIHAVLTAALFRAESVLGVQRRRDNSWDYYLEGPGRIAHVRLGALTAGTADELRRVLAALQRDGLDGLILDLRWCPGGLLSEAVVVAQTFLKVGAPVASVRYRNRPTADPYLAEEEGWVDIPMVVLVNSETSGGAELIAAALEDNRRARVVGQRTRGKASIQSLLALPLASAALKLTSGVFLRPSGKELHRSPDSKLSDDWGVRPAPDAEFRLPPDVDAQLRDWWLLQSLRPGPSSEALPLDDPENDPQRQAARRTLEEQIRRRRDEG